MNKKKIRIQQENSYKINFPTTTKKWHNRTTVLYIKYERNTKNYFPPEPKKLTQHHNCMVLQVHSSMYNQNLFPAITKNWHNSTTRQTDD